MQHTNEWFSTKTGKKTLDELKWLLGVFFLSLSIQVWYEWQVYEKDKDDNDSERVADFYVLW